MVSHHNVRYHNYVALAAELGVPTARGAQWSTHYRFLVANYDELKQADQNTVVRNMLDRYTEARLRAVAEGRSRDDGRPDYLGTYCITCDEDCVPLADCGGICPFCGRQPVSGEKPYAEFRREQWNEAKRRQREREKAAA